MAFLSTYVHRAEPAHGRQRRALVSPEHPRLVTPPPPGSNHVDPIKSGNRCGTTADDTGSLQWPRGNTPYANISLETASERTLWSSLKVGEQGGSPGLDVRGLEGGQDEGHLSAIRRQFGEQVIIHNHSSCVCRRQLELRQLQRDHLERKKTP